MRNMIAAAAIASSTLTLAAEPVLAAAHHRDRVLVCHGSRHRANNGTLIGAIGGGLLGNAVAGRGARTEGTVIGAGVGAVAGHQIGKHRSRTCHYEYRRR